MEKKKKEMEQFLCDTAVERSPEYIIKTREQGVEYYAQNATFSFKKRENVNKYVYLLLFLQNGRINHTIIKVATIRWKKKTQ